MVCRAFSAKELIISMRSAALGQGAPYILAGQGAPCILALLHARLLAQLPLHAFLLSSPPLHPGSAMLCQGAGALAMAQARMRDAESAKS